MNHWRIIKAGYAVMLWIAFNMLFSVQTMYGYGSRHELRYLLYLIAVEIVLVVVTIWIGKSRRVGLPTLILLSLLLGFIPYENGLPHLVSAIGNAQDGCSRFMCETTSIVRLMWSFTPSAAFFLMLLPLRIQNPASANHPHIN